MPDKDKPPATGQQPGAQTPADEDGGGGGGSDSTAANDALRAELEQLRADMAAMRTQNDADRSALEQRLAAAETEREAQKAAATTALTTTPVATPGPEPGGPLAGQAASSRKPEHPYYEVLADTWGYDAPGREARQKGEIIPAAEVGPHWEWAVRTGVIVGLNAKSAAAKRRTGSGIDVEIDEMSEDPEVVEDQVRDVYKATAPDPEDPPDVAVAKANARVRADVARQRAAENRQNLQNLRVGV
jgi:hypothetical protein